MLLFLSPKPTQIHTDNIETFLRLMLVDLHTRVKKKTRMPFYASAAHISSMSTTLGKKSQVKKSPKKKISEKSHR